MSPSRLLLEGVEEVTREMQQLCHRAVPLSTICLSSPRPRLSSPGKESGLARRYFGPGATLILSLHLPTPSLLLSRGLVATEYVSQYTARELPMTSRHDSGDHVGRAAASTNPQHPDGALDSAIAAAESAIQTLKLTQDPAERTRLSSKVEKLLAQIEALKLGGTPSNASNTGSRHPGTIGAQRRLKEPQSQRPLPKKEQILLLKSSFLHGFKFPPWTSTPEAKEFALADGEELFVYVHSTVVLIVHPH